MFATTFCLRRLFVFFHFVFFVSLLRNIDDCLLFRKVYHFRISWMVNHSSKARISHRIMTIDRYWLNIGVRETQLHIILSVIGERVTNFQWVLLKNVQLRNFFYVFIHFLQQCTIDAECHCQDAWNNTYSCIRHISRTENTIFCEFQDREVTSIFAFFMAIANSSYLITEFCWSLRFICWSLSD